MSSQRSHQPIRVALIGLSANAVTSWASSAHLPYLLSADGRAKYTITALCNSSVAAAEAAIKSYQLDSSTKAYGDPNDLARDDNVDLVVCNTRVDKHHETVLPSLKAGKATYIEWPIASNMVQTDELLQAARDTGAATIVGLQGRWAAPVVKMQDIIKSGRLGKVLSSDLRVFEAAMGRGSMPAGFKYFADRRVGGNPITIGFAHVFDWIQHSLGEVVPESLQARMQVQRQNNDIIDADTGEKTESVRADVPDLLTLQGELPQSANVVHGAGFSAYFRRGPPFRGEAALTWSVACEGGEVRLVAPSGLHLQAYACGPDVSIHIDHHDERELQRVDWSWTEAQEALPLNSRSVRLVYEAYATGNQDGWVSIEAAAARARQIERLLADFP